MSDASKAVFLSYASQDAEAAKRVADALRAAGVEVWFDAEGGLEHGDEWDRKIRRQIRECVLFIAVISANTEEREEGYFRLEWDLAAERARNIASGVAFILPVVIDGTKESVALVPDRFRTVQWTKLPGGNVPADVLQRFLKLWSHRTGALKPMEAARPRPAERGEGTPSPISSRPGWKIYGGLAVACFAIAAGAVAWLSRKDTPAKPAARPVTAPVAAPVTEGIDRKLPRPGVAAVAPTVGDKSIAVLPFANMSDDKDSNAFFADGIQEDVLTNLGALRALRVLSRTAVAQYRNTAKSSRQIGDELHAAYVLEGSVRRAGKAVRVTGQLIRAATDEQVWSKSYDRDITDIFAVQSELAQDIARALQAVLSPQEKASLARRPTESVPAYEAYLKGRESMQKSSGMARLTTAVTLLQQAVELDPKFALAWAELGDCHAMLAFEEWDRTPARLAAAHTAIETAVGLAPEDTGVIAKLGSYYLHADRDYVRASEEYVRLTILRPNDPEVLRALGRIHIRQGRWAEGAAGLQRALELDPGNIGEAGYLVTVLTDGRRYAEADILARRLVAAFPEKLDLAAQLAANELLARGSITGVDAFSRRTCPPDLELEGAFWRRFLARLRGDTKEAIRLDRESPYWEGAGPRWAQETAAALTLADAGDLVAARARATSALALMEAERPKQPASSWLFAWIGVAHALLGQKEAALANARHAMEILPESRDAVYGVENSVMLASVYAWVGEKDLALAELARLLKTPHGANVFAAARGSISTSAQVSFQPLWDDPRFQALLADPKNNEPLF